MIELLLKIVVYMMWDMLMNKEYLNKSVKVIDANGGTVLPGFIDSHFHVVRHLILSLDLVARSFKEIGESIKKASDASPKTYKGYRS